MDKRLEIGDTFLLEHGMVVSTNVEKRFVYHNRKYSTELDKAAITVGYKMIAKGMPTKQEKNLVSSKIVELLHTHLAIEDTEEVISKFIDNLIPTPPKYNSFTFEAGTFVVTQTSMGGGSDAESYPDGWYITAKRLAGDIYNPNGDEISFYQSGSFNVMVKPKDIKLVGKLEMTFVAQSR